MTLKQKFENVDILFESQLLKLKYDENMDCADDCEKIADDYAIEFAEWIRENYYDVGDSWCEWNSDKDTYSSKELLEIFKKEKGL